MLTSSSAAQFAPSSSATPTRTAVDAVPDAPSTSLGARTVTPVPVQQQVRDLKSGETTLSAAATRAVDSKSPANTGSAFAGDSHSPEGRAAQRQSLLDGIPSHLARLTTLSETRDKLRSCAIQLLKHPPKEVDSWLADEATTIKLLHKDNFWTSELDDDEWTESLACYCATNFGSYNDIPEELRSNPRVKRAMSDFSNLLIQSLVSRVLAGEGGSSS